MDFLFKRVASGPFGLILRFTQIILRYTKTVI